MLNSIIRNYFTNRDYGLLYLHNAFKTVSFFSMGVFISGWLYKLGIDLHWIILYQAANFTLMGLLSPIGGFMANKYGLTISFALSFTCYFLSLIALSAAENSSLFILLGLIFSATANGLQNPPDMMMHAAYVQNENRGKAFSIVSIIATLATSLSVLLSGWLIEEFGFWGLSVVCGVFWILSLLCVARMNDKFRNSENIKISRYYTEIFYKKKSKSFRIGARFSVPDHR